MRSLITAVGFVLTAIMLVMALIMVCATNLVVNGYHRECGIWRNAVPFACSPKKEAAAPRVSAVRYDAPSYPPPRASAKPTRQAARPAAAPRLGRCAPLQQQPYRVQCDPGTGACYHDPGFRANCGLADNWYPR
jgi:hypothetical protein